MTVVIERSDRPPHVPPGPRPGSAAAARRHHRHERRGARHRADAADPTPTLGYQVVGLLECGDTTLGVVTPVPVLGNWSDALEIVQSVDVTGVIIATSAIDIPVANRLARELIELGYHVELTSGLVDISADRLSPGRSVAGRSCTSSRSGCSGWRAVAKRLFDIVVAAGLLVFGCAGAVARPRSSSSSTRRARCSSPGAGRQGRQAVPGPQVPHDGRPTPSSMLDVLREQSEVDGPLFKMRDDPRVTRVGALPAQVVDRRAPAAVERARRRDERRRSPSRAPERDVGVGRRPAEPVAGQARHHRHVAGQRAQHRRRSTTTSATTSTTSTTGRC